MKTEMCHWEHHNRLRRVNDLNGGSVFIAGINWLVANKQTDEGCIRDVGEHFQNLEGVVMSEEWCKSAEVCSE